MALLGTNVRSINGTCEGKGGDSHLVFSKHDTIYRLSMCIGLTSFFDLVLVLFICMYVFKLFTKANTNNRVYHAKKNKK